MYLNNVASNGWMSLWYPKMSRLVGPPAPGLIAAGAGLAIASLAAEHVVFSRSSKPT